MLFSLAGSNLTTFPAPKHRPVTTPEAVTVVCFCDVFM